MSRRRRMAGTLLAVGALGLAGAGCGETPEDTAKDRGQDVGEAVRQLVDARSIDEVQTAATEVKDAVAAVGDDGGDRVQAQLRTQQDKANQAIGDLKSTLTSGDDDAAASARTELQGDLQDLRAQASAFRGSNDSVANAFWDGVKDGYDGD
jgi:hypothetical protein